MNVTRKLVTSLLLTALFCTEACTKKKPLPPPQTPAPTIAEALPEEIPEEHEVKPPLPPPAQPSRNETQQANKQQKKSGKGTNKKTSSPANTTAAVTTTPTTAPAQTPPQNTNPTVANLHPPQTKPEAPPEMTVAAAISSDQANRQRENTAHIVDATENALKSLTRQLNDEEKNMRTQIETYLQQSRKATADGDYERALKLAEKAQTLVAALIKQ